MAEHSKSSISEETRVPLKWLVAMVLPCILMGTMWADLRRLMSDSWTRTEMKVWSQQLQIANGTSLKVPDVDDASKEKSH